MINPYVPPVLPHRRDDGVHYIRGNRITDYVEDLIELHNVGTTKLDQVGRLVSVLKMVYEMRRRYPRADIRRAVFRRRAVYWLQIALQKRIVEQGLPKGFVMVRLNGVRNGASRGA